MSFDLPETNNYYTQVGHSGVFQRDVYQIVNRHTNVIEFENPVFANIREIIGDLEEALVNPEGEQNDLDIPDFATVTSTLN